MSFIGCIANSVLFTCIVNRVRWPPFSGVPPQISKDINPVYLRQTSLNLFVRFLKHLAHIAQVHLLLSYHAARIFFKQDIAAFHQFKQVGVFG